MFSGLIIALTLFTGTLQKGATMDVIKIQSIDGRSFELNDNDMSLIERVTSAEGKGEPEECQIAIATVVLNRLASPNYPDSVAGVVYQDHQFVLDKSEEVPVNVKMSVLCAVTLYNSKCQIIPFQTYYFRNNHYHNFGVPYRKIGNTYFSLSDNVIL